MVKKHERIMLVFKEIQTGETKKIGQLKKQAFTRNRKLNFEDLMKYIICRKGLTTTMEIDNYYKNIGKKDDAVTKQAFCKQRLNLNPEVFVYLNKRHVRRIYDDPNYKLHKGYIITAIDGTVLEIPNTEELRQTYGYLNPNKDDVRKMARARASGIYDIENNIMIDAIIEKYRTSERVLAGSNICNALETLGDDRKIITIFDRGYFSTEMLMFLLECPIKFLFRLQGNTFNKEKNSMQSDDEIVEFKTNGNRLSYISDKYLKQKASMLKAVPLRMVKIKLNTGEYEYLVTNILKEEFSTEEIGVLYSKRWGIETAYDLIKNKLHIENISGKKPIIVEQDFYAQILLFNLIQDLKNDANYIVDENKNKKGKLKYCYKVNMNILVGKFREYIIKMVIEEDTAKQEALQTDMMNEITKNLVPIRPGRSNPHVKYKGRNRYMQNNKPNS